jgi:CBS domain-containing protein
MPIGEICNREVVIVNRNESVSDAAKLMRQYHVGDVVVVDEKDGSRIPVGVLTDRDITVEIVAEGIDADSITVGDAMSLELITVSEQEGILEALELMRTKGVRRIPVTGAGGNLVGIITIDDLLELLAVELNSLVSVIRREQIKERKAHP